MVRSADQKAGRCQGRTECITEASIVLTQRREPLPKRGKKKTFQLTRQSYNHTITIFICELLSKELWVRKPIMQQQDYFSSIRMNTF